MAYRVISKEIKEEALGYLTYCLTLQIDRALALSLALDQ
jgi:hypothetical protein